MCFRAACMLVQKSFEVDFTAAKIFCYSKSIQSLYENRELLVCTDVLRYVHVFSLIFSSISFADVCSWYFNLHCIEASKLMRNRWQSHVLESETMVIP